MVNELQQETLSKVKYALCKTMAKHLSNKNVASKPINEDAQIQEKAAAEKVSSKSVKFDNVFDLVFNSNSMVPKESISK